MNVIFLPEISDMRTRGLTRVGHEVVVRQADTLGRSCGTGTVGHGHDVRVGIKLVLSISIQRPVIGHQDLHEGFTICWSFLHSKNNNLLDLGCLQVGRSLFGLLQEQAW